MLREYNKKLVIGNGDRRVGGGRSESYFLDEQVVDPHTLAGTWKVNLT